MTSANTASTTAGECKYPGCDQRAAASAGPGRPPQYCEGREHTKVTAWRERRRLAAVAAGTTAVDTDKPVSHARITGAELLRSLRAEADRVAGIAELLRDAIETATDPTAAEVEVEAIRAAAEQRAAAAESRAAAAEQRTAEADQWRAEADAAAEEMAGQLAAAQTAATEADSARTAAEHERDTIVSQVRAEAAAQISAAEAERDTAVGEARAEAGARVSAAETEGGQARQDAAQAEENERRARQEAIRAQASAEAAREETGRVRADAGKALAGSRAEAAAEIAAVRTDLRTRAERAEHEADACRAELAGLRDQLTHDGSDTTRPPRRTVKP